MNFECTRLLPGNHRLEALNELKQRWIALARKGGTMKKILLGSAAFVMISVGSAVAADMPVKAPPLPPPVMLWDAVYVGLEGGYGWKENHWNQTLTFGAIPLDNFKEAKT